MGAGVAATSRNCSAKYGMDARQLEPTAGGLEVEVPPFGQRLSEQRLVECDRPRLASLERLDERLRERAAQPERLADRPHLGAERAIGPGELLELEPWRFHGDVVERGLERRRRLLGDVVRQLVERVADGEQRGQLRDREAGRLARKSRRARHPRVHLDHAQLVGLRMNRELHVRSARGHTDPARGGEGGLTEPLVRGVGERLLRRDRPRVAGVHAHRVKVLDRADDDRVPCAVDHHLELVLLPAGEVLLDQHLADGAGSEAVCDRLGQLRPCVCDPAAGAPERERRADDRRDREVDIGRRGHDRARNRETSRLHGLTEELTVLGAPDRVDVGADQLDAAVGERHRQVERGLPAERGQDRVGALPGDHLADRVRVEWLEVGRVGPFRVGHDRGGVRVDEHDAVALPAQHATCLRACVVELARLADPNRPRAENQDRAKVGALRHAFASRSKKGRPSSGPGDASGWNWTLANPSPTRPSQVPSFSDTNAASSSAATA